MSRKQSKESKEYKQGVASFNLWVRYNKRLEKKGLHGTDYYIKIIEKLEAKVKRLEAKLERKSNK
jgi:hypothetical protein